MVKILVAFYSTYGHTYAMAKAAAEGITAAGATAVIRRIKETLPDEVLVKMHALEAQKAFADVPLMTTPELSEYDGVIIATGTRFGGIPAQMSTFFDTTGQHWYNGTMVGKVGSAICATGSQHGGLEQAYGVIHTYFFHMGMVVVGLPVGQVPDAGTVAEVHGVTPYGAGTVTGGQGQRMPSAIELEGAKIQGKHVATIATKLSA